MKLVFMSHDEPEIDALINNRTGEPRARIDVWTGDNRTQQSESTHVPLKIDQWVDFKFVVSRKRFSCFVDGQLMADAERNRLNPGFVAIGTGGWVCEMKHPQVILHKVSDAVPTPPGVE